LTGGIFVKKLINCVENVEREMIEGLVKAYPNHVRKLDCGNVVVRAHKKEGKVALISGGGSGHEPAHGGYVGEGMLDCAVAGPVFTSPTPDQIYEGMKAIATDKGVLMVVKNYTGDVMNFEMAAEMAQADGVDVQYVVTNDDVAVKDSLYTTGRRGVAGTVFVHKIAGAKAETGADLNEVHRVAQKVVDNVRTMGMALTPCTVPAAGKPGFELNEDEMEIGIGIHGEPGTHR
jgi:dihydroxyacetone kinase-like protein